MMDIHEHARKGTLVGAELNDRVKKNPSVLNERDPKTGLTLLAAAVAKGHVGVVELLLKKCARADVPSEDGKTPLLLATCNPIMNRPRIIQLLLRKTPPCFVDTTCPDADNNTPLMFAIKQKDLESIRLLRNAGACPMRRNNDGFSAKDLAEQTEDKAIQRALFLDKEQSDLFKLAKLVLDLLLFVITWVNQVTGAICRMYKLDTEMYQFTKELVMSPICEPNRCPNQISLKPPCDLPDDDMCTGERPSPEDDSDKQKRKAELVGTIGNIVKRIAPESLKGKEDYIEEVARNVVDVENDPNTSPGSKGLLEKTIEVSWHQQVVYCDDSCSMGPNPQAESEKTRWDCQKELVERIAHITTRILPKGEGVVLRFINQNVKKSNLTFAEIGDKLAEMSPVPPPKSHSKIGTCLASKILKPLVYEKLEKKSLDRPLLISIITDGRPNIEDPSTLVNAILECGKRLEAAKYRRGHVKFVIGQVGEAKEATDFLDTIRNTSGISDVVYCISDRLDEKFAEFHENKQGLDQWVSTAFVSLLLIVLPASVSLTCFFKLIETLHKPIETSYKPIEDVEQ